MNEEFINKTLRKVYELEHQLAIEKMKTKQVSESLKQVIDMTKIPKESIRWYKLLGGKTMVKTSKKSRRSKRSGSRNDGIGSRPITTWGPEVTPGLPGAIGLPPIRPTLMRSPAERGPVRRLDFSSEPGCASIKKRLPDHPDDQCEQSESVDSSDLVACIQPGERGITSLSHCGPTRSGGKRRKTRKTKHKRKV